MLYNMNFISFHRNYRSGSQKYSSLQEVQKEIFEDSIQDLVGKQHIKILNINIMKKNFRNQTRLYDRDGVLLSSQGCKERDQIQMARR